MSLCSQPDSLHSFFQVLPCKAPVDLSACVPHAQAGRFGSEIIVFLKAQDPNFHRLSICQVIGRECFSLQDREIDLNLVEPTGMDLSACVPHAQAGGQMNSDGIFIGIGKPFRERSGVMRGSIIHNPEDPVCRSIRLLFHHQVHQLLKRHDAGFFIHTPKDVP